MKLKMHYNNDLVLSRNTITNCTGRTWVTKFLDKSIEMLRSRGRMVTINGNDGKLFMERGYLLFKDRTDRSNAAPKKLPFNILLHKIYRSDPDGYHDHPWPFVSIILHGNYDEFMKNSTKVKHRTCFSLALRWTNSKHRIEILPGQVVYTVIFRGPRKKDTFSKN